MKWQFSKLIQNHLTYSQFYFHNNTKTLFLFSPFFSNNCRVDLFKSCIYLIGKLLLVETCKTHALIFLCVQMYLLSNSEVVLFKIDAILRL